MADNETVVGGPFHPFRPNPLPVPTGGLSAGNILNLFQQILTFFGGLVSPLVNPTPANPVAPATNLWALFQQIFSFFSSNSTAGTLFQQILALLMGGAISQAKAMQMLQDLKVKLEQEHMANGGQTLPPII
jgi:hypothetical protein